MELKEKLLRLKFNNESIFASLKVRIDRSPLARENAQNNKALAESGMSFIYKILRNFNQNLLWFRILSWFCCLVLEEYCFLYFLKFCLWACFQVEIQLSASVNRSQSRILLCEIEKSSMTIFTVRLQYVCAFNQFFTSVFRICGIEAFKK